MAPSKFIVALSVAWHGADSVRLARKKIDDIHGVPIYDVEVGVRSSNDLIVAFKPGAHDSDIEQFCAKQKCYGKGHPNKGGVAYAGVRMGPELDAAIKDQADQLEFLQYDAELQDYDLPEGHPASVVERSTPWGLERVGVPRSKYKGDGTHIYVLDSGIRTSHGDFGGRAIPTLDARAAQPPQVCDPSDRRCARDTRGHGTHVAGSAGGTNYGVAPKALVYAIERGRSYVDAFNCLDWVTLNYNSPAVLTISFGGRGNYLLAEQVLDSVVAAGVTVTVAAGNDGHDGCKNTWAFIPSAITVGSTDENNKRSVFSNYGNCVDIFAPGSNILSASHRGDRSKTKKSGTSMANPHVAGGAALILQQNPSYSPAQVKASLAANAQADVVKDPQGTPNLLMSVA